MTMRSNILRLALAALLLSLPSAAGAQATSTAKKGKGIPTATVSAEWGPLQVDHYVGIRGGYGMGNARFEPQRQTEWHQGLYEFGVLYKLDVPKQKYVGTMEFGINYSEKGYVVHQGTDSEIVDSRKYSTLQLPILWQPYLPLGRGGSRFYLTAGPVVSYALKSTYRIYNYTTDETIEEGPYEYSSVRDNRWEYGLIFGGGFIVNLGGGLRITLEGRYNITLSDTYKSVTKYSDNPFRSPVDQINVTAGILYRIPNKKFDRAVSEQSVPARERRQKAPEPEVAVPGPEAGTVPTPGKPGMTATPAETTDTTVVSEEIRDTTLAPDEGPAGSTVPAPETPDTAVPAPQETAPGKTAAPEKKEPEAGQQK